MEEKDKKDKKVKEYKKIPEDNSDKCWPHYPFFEDELKPIGEEQWNMSEEEFRKWVKEQGY